MLVFLLLLFPLLSPSPGAAQGNPVLYVFLQTSIKPNALQKLLKKHLTNVDITVFGRFRDFEKGIKAGNHDAVLALPPVLEAQKLKVTLRGMRSSKDSVPYVLMSNGAPIDKNALAGKMFGVVDILGRKRMAKFVGGVLGLGSTPKIKSVTKTEDLLPLLQFKIADALLLPENDADSLKQKSQMSLVITKTGASIGLPAVACNASQGAEICKLIGSLNAGVNRQMGVESWK